MTKNSARMDSPVTYEDIKELLGISELYTVTREQVEQELETVLNMVDEGHSPILITVEGKPDLLLFGWEDYKHRFSHLYPPEELERLEEALRKHQEESDDLRDV